MTLSPTDRTKLNALDPNLASGVVADPALRKAVFDEIYVYLDSIISDGNAAQGAGAVTTSKLADGSVVTVKLADLGVTTGKVADGAIVTAKLADGSVTTMKIADGSITTAKLAAGSVTVDKLSPDIQTSGQPEVALARVSVPSNKTYDTLKARLDDEIGNLSDSVADYVPDKNKGYVIFGQEYLSSFHKKLMTFDPTTGTTSFNVVFSGDSTTYGVSITDTKNKIDALFKELCVRAGFPKINTYNHGQSGKDTEHWRTTYVTDDLSANPDVLFLRWGINDPVYSKVDNSALADLSVADPTIDAQRRGVTEFETSLRSGLQTIRASKDVTQLAIVLCVPNSTNDTPNRRDKTWYESIVPVIQKAARDFQCCFLNIYQDLQDSINAQDWMDNLYGDGRHIHPLDVGNLWVSSIYMDILFPSTFRIRYGAGKVQNVHSSYQTINVPATYTPSVFDTGISLHRTTSGFPVNGELITIKSVDNTSLQIHHNYDDANPYIAFRVGNPTANTWSSWLNPFNYSSTITAPSLLNGWTNYDAGTGPTGHSQAGYWLADQTEVRLKGILKPGTTAANTTLFQLPVGYRPASVVMFPVATNAGMGVIHILSTGEVQIDSLPAGVTYISLDGISFRLGAI